MTQLKQFLLIVTIVIMLASCSFEPPVPTAEEEALSLETTMRDQGQEGKVLFNSLLAQASDKAMTGQIDQAIALSERVLRLEPQDPQIWYRLARLYVQQGDFKKAESYALRTIRFSGDNRDLKIKGWRLIEQSRMLFGNMAGARYASQRAEELEKL